MQVFILRVLQTLSNICRDVCQIKFSIFRCEIPSFRTYTHREREEKGTEADIKSRERYILMNAPSVANCWDPLEADEVAEMTLTERIVAITWQTCSPPSFSPLEAVQHGGRSRIRWHCLWKSRSPGAALVHSFLLNISLFRENNKHAKNEMQHCFPLPSCLQKGGHKALAAVTHSSHSICSAVIYLGWQ